MLAEVQDIGYRFKGEAAPALSGVSLTLRPGEVMGLIGPDGAGKTTLLRLMAGLLCAQQGRVAICGLDPVREHAAIAAQVGYMTQGFSLYADLTIAENMRLFARLKGIEPAARAESEAAALLELAGLAPFRHRLAGKLSGGMKQKLALICALYGNPPVLLLDEPGVGVDPVSRRALWQLVEQARASGRGIVWATAYLDEAARCDRVCILHEGRVRFLGTPEELLAPLRGRVFALAAPPAERLPLLRRLRSSPAVMDAMIEGAHVRFLLRGSATPANALPPGAAAVEPNVEEAFINLLGGVPGHRRPPRSELPPQEQSAAPLIITEGLTKKFGDFTATDNLSIRVRRGEIFGILGANGAGKTTAFRMMCGLLPATGGKATMLGIDLLRDARKARAHLGYMAQKFSLYGTLTVRQNLRFFASVYGLKGEKRQRRMDEVAARFDLLPHMEHAAGSLPVGIRQRLSMACATLHEPEFLFLDEPTSGVDPFARREFWEEINEMAATGVTIIVTTHFMDEAQYLHRMVIMDKGRVIAEGTPEELKAAAATPRNPLPTMEDAFIHFIDRPSPPGSHPSPPGSRSFTAGRSGGMSRLFALTVKEWCQVRRDSSSLLLAFVIPVLMILLFGFCINLDSSTTKLALVVQDEAPAAHQLVERLSGSPNFVVERAEGEAAALRRLQLNKVQGVLVIPNDFSASFGRGAGARLLLATDGTSPNTAQFTAAYVQGVYAAWAAEQGAAARASIDVETSYRFNPTADSPHSLLPGTVALVLSFVGSFLTAMVVAREWERGTVELVLASPTTRAEFVLSKLIPYFVLGLVAMGVCVLAAVFIFSVPMRAPLWQPFAVAGIFLVSVLSIGLLISTLLKNQYSASLIVMVVSLLPTMLLSGFVFEVSSMPVVIQLICNIIPASYFVPTLSTLFLAGGMWSAVWEDVLALAFFGLFWLILVIRATPRRLDS